MPAAKKAVAPAPEVDEEDEDMPEEEVNAPLPEAQPTTTPLAQTTIPGVELPETRKRKKRLPMSLKEWTEVADRMKALRTELGKIYEIIEGGTTSADAALIGSAIRTLGTASRRAEVAAYRQVGGKAVGLFEMGEDQEDLSGEADRADT